MGASSTRAVVVAAARTAIGTARKGTLANMESKDLAKPVVTAAIERSGLDVTDFDDLVLAEVLQGGGDIARYVAVELGLSHLAGSGGQPPMRVGTFSDRRRFGPDRRRNEPGHPGRWRGVALHHTLGPEASAVHHGKIR